MIKKPMKVKIILAVVKQPLSKVVKKPEKIQAFFRSEMKISLLLQDYNSTVDNKKNCFQLF